MKKDLVVKILKLIAYIATAIVTALTTVQLSSCGSVSTVTSNFMPVNTSMDSVAVKYGSQGSAVRPDTVVFHFGIK